MDRGKGKGGNVEKNPRGRTGISNLVTRSITGIIFVAVIIGSIYAGPVFFVSLFGIVTLVSLNEFYRLVYGRDHYFLKATGVFTGTYLYIITALYFAGELESLEVFAWLIPIIFLSIISQLWLKAAQPFHLLGLLFTGWIYVALPFSLLTGIAFDADHDYMHEILVCAFSFIWINDTGAYLTGSRWGKHPLFSRISPKKTIEGTLGGMLLVIIAAFVIARLQDILSLEECIISGLILSVFSILGDLVESMLKRSLGVKDSGNLLPGHGGLLDRFDALLGAIPFLYFYLNYLR